MNTPHQQTVKYIDGIRPPQRKVLAPIQIEMDLGTPTNIQIRKMKQSTSDESTTQSNKQATPFKDYYAEVATRAWSQGKKPPLRRTVKEHAKSYLDSQGQQRQTKLGLDKSLSQAEIVSTYDR